MRLVVVGAGIAGSSLTRLARESGHDVTLVSGDPPHSLAAVAVMRRAYHKGPERDLWTRSMDMYRRWGFPVMGGASVTSYRAEPRQDWDWWIIDPAAPLLKPDITATVTGVSRVSVTADSSTIEVDAVVLATGATSGWTRPGKVTWGVTWVHADPYALKNTGEAVLVHHRAPYKTLTAGVAGGRARLGSSTGKDPLEAFTRADAQLELAESLGWLTTTRGWRAQLGARLLRDGKRAWRGKSGAWRLGGFHRTGYALAPAVAEDLLRRIEENSD